MKTPMLFFMAICSAISYAQPSLSVLQKDILSVSQSTKEVIPYPLEVTYDKTTHLIFPTAIRYVDLGSEHLIAEKAKEAENVLRVKATTPDFTEKTNLSVITEDGGFFSFEVCYHPAPKLLTLDFARKIPQGNSVKSDILFSDTGWESPAVASYQGLCQGEKWLDTQEVCLMLGISKRALQNYKDQKILPCSFIHRKNYFKMSDVQALLSSQNFKK